MGRFGDRNSQGLAGRKHRPLVNLTVAPVSSSATTKSRSVTVETGSKFITLVIFLTVGAVDQPDGDFRAGWPAQQSWRRELFRLLRTA
jgi:hypothetical protein